MSTKLDRLREKEVALQARLQNIQAQRRDVSRKEDTRKKVLIGAVILNRIELGLESEETLMNWLAAGLIRNADRVVFGLPLLNENAAEPSQPKAKKASPKTEVAAQSLVAGTVQNTAAKTEESTAKLGKKSTPIEPEKSEKQTAEKRVLPVSKTQKQLEDEFV